VYRTSEPEVNHVVEIVEHEDTETVPNGQRQQKKTAETATSRKSAISQLMKQFICPNGCSGSNSSNNRQSNVERAKKELYQFYLSHMKDRDHASISWTA